MQASKFRASLFGWALAGLLVFSLVPGCGTQTGNPPTLAQSSLFYSTESVTNLLNGLFAESIDSLNLGDYAYSASESRVISSEICLGQGSQAPRLQRLTATEHSVELEATDRNSLAELDIVRTYSDSWRKNGEPLGCDLETASLAMEFAAGDEFILESHIEEVHQRQLTVEKKLLAETLSHFIDRRKIGRRQLHLKVDSLDEDSLWLAAQLDEMELERRLLLPAQDDGRIRQQKLAVDSGFDLQFRIEIDADSRQLKAYEIGSAQLNYKLVENQRVQMTISDLRIEIGDRCFPSQGQLEVVLQDGDESETFSLDFSKDSERAFLGFTSSEGRSIDFMPEACVLDER